MSGLARAATPGFIDVRRRAGATEFVVDETLVREPPSLPVPVDPRGVDTRSEALEIVTRRAEFVWLIDGGGHQRDSVVRL